MAFSNYSNLFKSGLLSNDSSPLYTSHPWSAEYIGPRRGSLPGPIEQIPPPLPSAISIPETMGESIASGESFYFTFKKRRNPSVYRSFLSLDLAESQSLRSASLRGKESQEGLSSLYARVPLSRFPASIYPTTFSTLYSPPPTSSPPRSPISPHSVPDPELSPNPFGLSISAKESYRLTLFSPPPSSNLKPPPLTSPRKRSLSPMRFASPPPSPPPSSHFDAASAITATSSGVLSRNSTVSSGYRRAQRNDALKRLEGRGADGAVGRLVPRVSQNFMSMSDDEDEDEEDEILHHAGIDLIVEDTMREDEQWDSEGEDILAEPPKVNKSMKGHGLSVSIDSAALYNITPRASAWGMFLSADDSKKHLHHSDKLVPFDLSGQEPDVIYLSTKTSSKTSKQSKRSSTSRSPRQEDRNLKSRSPSQLPGHLHPLSHYTSSSSSSSPQSQSQSRSHSKSSRSKSSSSPRSHSSSPRNGSTSRSQSQQSRLPPRLDLLLELASSPNHGDDPNFIDLRDETDSRSDSWRSIFEVSCNA